MNQLAHLADLALDDPSRGHRLALAAGAGVWLTAEEERIGTSHELVALKCQLSCASERQRC